MPLALDAAPNPDNPRVPTPSLKYPGTQLVDLWPRKVARFVEDGGGGAFPLEGKPNTFGSLTAPKEGSVSRGGAVECAHRAHGLIAQALGELRPHVPTPPPGEVDNPASSSPLSPSLQSGRGGKAGGSVVGSGGVSPASPKAAAAAASPGKVKPVPMSAGDSEEEYTEEETSGVAAGQGTGGKRGRKRQRVKDEAVAAEDGGGAAGAAYQRGREANNGVEDMDDDTDDNGGEGGAESREDNAGGPAGAGEMTVAAVRESLLSNPSEDQQPGPSPQEWEVAVKKFISHVESLPPGTEQEELSLMFAAALDPTLVRLRMANTKLIALAEACLSQGGQDPDDDGEDSDGPNGGAGKGGGAKKNGFKVRLELEAPEEGAPPPDGIAGVLRAVAAAAAAVEAAARAEACVICGGDTLGGLGEIKRDYKRCLPPGPREPVSVLFNSF